MEEQSMSTSMVTKAMTAFHSAADRFHLKSDLPDEQSSTSSEPEELKSSGELKQSWWKSSSVGTKQEWHERVKNLGKGRKGTKDVKIECPKMAFPIYDSNLYLYNEKVYLESQGLEAISPTDSYDVTVKDIIPSSTVLKQLAIAIESEKNYRSVKKLLTSTSGSSPVAEKASLGISAVKTLVLGGKEERINPECGDHEAWSFIQSILDAEGLSLNRKVGFSFEALPDTISSPREIHGAPPKSLIVKVSEVMGSFKTLRKMASFWCRFVSELRMLWSDMQYVPGIPHDEIPDLNCCLLYQQMQLINCCISRKNRSVLATDAFDALIREAECDVNGIPSSIEKLQSRFFLYAKTLTGEIVLRLGASHQVENLTMLETGEPIYAPVTQEGPLLTEDLVQEAEEFVMQTGSVGAGCLHLLSDMQAFKAANPGCILEDFVRWHSPPDWTETDSTNDCDSCSGGHDSTPSRGRLSARMHKAGNLWRELWESAKPVPVVRQAPLLDEDLAVEGVFALFEKISPSQLFGQLFQSLIGLGLVIAEVKLPSDENLVKLFYECKDYITTLCQTQTWMEKIDDLCQVYETIEAILVRPEELKMMIKQPDDVNTGEEPRHRFKKLAQIFGRRNRLRNSGSGEQSPLQDSPTRRIFSNFFDSKSSLFSKKPPKPENSPSLSRKTSIDHENDWTMV